jgi:hypothetical protein
MAADAILASDRTTKEYQYAIRTQGTQAGSRAWQQTIR